VADQIQMSASEPGGIDWSLIDETDRNSLHSPGGVSAMRRIAQQFLRARSLPLDVPPRILKLFQVLQAIVGCLCTSQDRPAELQSAQTAEPAASRGQPQTQLICAQCPACERVLHSMSFLDGHIRRRRPLVLPSRQIVGGL
jgi:hypothetical protein